ncbi:MAG: tetratricopeptide repeat protein [Planctomycetota bacterium]
MKSIVTRLPLLGLLICGALLYQIPAVAQMPTEEEVNRQAAQWEADLGRYKDSSSEAAEALFKLTGLYHQHGRVYGLARVAQQFTATHGTDPRHKEVMLKLLDALEILSRNKDFAATCRQYIARYPQAPEVPAVEIRLANALLRMDDRLKAGEACAQVWTRRGPDELGRNYGVLAMRQYSVLATAEGMTRAATLADEMLTKLPAAEFARHVAWQGFTEWRRASQWAKANATGTAMLAKNIVGDPRATRDLHLLMAENFANLGQYANSVDSYKKARTLNDNAFVHHQIGVRLYQSGVKATELEPVVNEYVQKYPQRSDRFVLQSYLAAAWLRDGDKPKALALLQALLPQDAVTNNNASVFVQNNGMEPAQLAASEAALRAALGTNKDHAAYLRYVLAFDLYRDRVKDIAKARQAIRELLAESPSDDPNTAAAADWLLTSAPNDDEFRADLTRILQVRKAFIHYVYLRGVPANWQKNAAANKDLKVRADIVAAALATADQDPIVKAWIDQRDATHGPGAPIRDQLRQAATFNTLNDSLAKSLLAIQASYYRSYGPATDRAKTAIVWAQYCQRFPRDFLAAAAYLEAATDYSPGEVCKEAALHLLKIEAPAAAPDVWRRLLIAADRAADPALAKQVFAWTKQAADKFGFDPTYASAIADSLVKMKLDAEAVEWLNRGFKHDSTHLESRECAGRLLARITDPVQRAAFIQPLMQAETDFHGRYAMWLAGDAYTAGDWAKFEQVLRAARTRQNERPFRAWDLDWSIVGPWLDGIRADMKATPEVKTKVLTVLRDIELQPISAAANLALLELAPPTAVTPIQRLMTYRDATRSVGVEYYDWDRVMTFAVAAAERKDYAVAATIATGMIANLPNVDEGRRKVARDLVTQSYARMGSIGLTLDENSPLAPLFQATLHLRLGDERLAFETYSANRKLFDENRAELPVDLVSAICERLMAAGGDENHDYVEETLRGWLVKNAESKQIDDATKARVQLLLAKNYVKAQRFDIARNEYTTVVNRYPNTAAAIDAEFGIGETFMSQKVFDQAELVFERLARHPDVDVVVRAEFLRGVLAFRRGDRDDAREIFRSVLERVPNVELANQTLFGLAEVYGAEERYMDQLNLLRTVGRLGRASKRRHVPGTPLSIVVHDGDLGISRGHNRIPVRVTTEPGGDSELIYLTSAGAGKGLFRVDLETRLGNAAPDDRVLQLTGKDTIKCDYPPEFKAEFKNVPLSDVEIKVAADGRLEAASGKIMDKQARSFSDELRQQVADDQDADKRVSQFRPENQIKPGNQVYLRVKDADRDLGNEIDKIVVKLAADSGDQVQVTLKETGAHTGIFEGSALTGELPAGARATDSAIDHHPLMAIDRDPKSFWMSAPDGATPKQLTVDLKDLRSVARVKISTPDATKNAPVRGELRGSQDGEFWFRLATNPPPAVRESVAGEFAAMRRRVYAANFTQVTDWNQIVALTKNGQPIADEAVTDLSWSLTDGSNTAKQPHTVVWHGKLVQPRDGAARIKVDGARTTLMLDGREELALGPGGRSCDVWLTAGTHDLTIVAATAAAEQPVSAVWTRADLNTSQITLAPFRAQDFDLKQAAARVAPSGLGKTTAKPISAPAVTVAETDWEFKFPAIPLRFTQLIVHEYRGDAVAINMFEVGGTQPTAIYIPTKTDVLSLANNDVLEIAGGDTVTASYTDDLLQSESGGSQLLVAKLTATYHNARVASIGYDFLRMPNGAVVTTRKDLMRVEPGERVVVEIIDYDEDRTDQRDTIRFQVLVNDNEPIDMIATETENYSGIFTKEIDTVALRATKPASDKPEKTTKPDSSEKTSARPGEAAANAAPSADSPLPVKAGDRIYLRYIDAQNTFPGHAVPRETTVYVNEPAEGRIRILRSRVTPPPPGTPGRGTPVYLPPVAAGDVAGVAFEAPLTVEVIDPDAAKDSRSTVNVTLTTTDGASVDVACVISGELSGVTGDTADIRALEEGRFVGQVILQLGSKSSPATVPLTAEMPRGLLGKVKIDDNDGGNLGTNLVTRVLNVTGKDQIIATYRDAARPKGQATTLTARGRLISNGELAITDREYEKPVERLHVGEKLFVRVMDADHDATDERDHVTVEITGDLGEKEIVKLEETLAHSGVFTGSFTLKALEKPVVDNLVAADPAVETYFGDTLRVRYVDDAASGESGTLELVQEMPVVIGTDGLVAAFSKTFANETLAVETKFRIAESYFELFKSHKSLERADEKNADLEAGRRILREVMEDYPDPKHAPRIAYLLGQFSQELGQFAEAIKSYEMILRQYSDNPLAPDAQYKLAQCHEEAGEFDLALEAYVTLAATHPRSPLIPNVMIRISDHFYKTEQYAIAAQVGEKFLERFTGHQHGPRMAFRVGQCYYKGKLYLKAGQSFDRFGKVFPDDNLAADALFWSGESFRLAANNLEAFRRYNRCRWDYPASEAAKYARGRLALPEMLQQFEADAASADPP